MFKLRENLNQYVERHKKRNDLKPSLLRFWKHFDDISKTPRPSEHEGKMGILLEKFARERNIKFEKDEIGNVLMILPATESLRNAPKLIVQAHQDMVCLGEPDPAG